MEKFLNIDSSETAKNLAFYIDMHLKKSGGHTGLVDDGLNPIISSVLVLFKQVHAKDVFEAFY